MLKAVAQKLSPLPARNFELTLRDSYLGLLASLREEVDVLGNVDAPKFATDSRGLDFPLLTVARLAASAKIYEAVLADLNALGDRTEEYGMPAFTDTFKSALPPPMRARFLLAQLLKASSTASLANYLFISLRSNMAAMVSISSGATRAQNMLALLDESLQTSLQELASLAVKLVGQAIAT